MFMKKQIIIKWIKENRNWLISYVVLVVFTLFFALIKQNQISFFCISLFINVFLVHIIHLSKNVLKIKWTKKEKIIISIAILFIYLFYFISLISRNFIYYWDYACYYNIQIETIDRFKEGLFSGIRSLVSSTWGGEYGNFLSFIVQAPFSLTTKTPNAYVGSCIFLFSPYIVLSLSILLKKLILILKETKKEIIFGITLLAFILFPLIYSTSIYGQPDLFGLFFAFIIVALTIKYDFKKLEYERLVLLFFTTYMLFICRRWYIYWVISYYAIYGISLIYNTIRDKKNRVKKIQHILSYVTICALIFLVTLFPLLKNIIINDYANHYVFYAAGGFFKELEYQVGHLGIVMAIVAGVGLIIGIIEKKYRTLAISSIVQILIIVFLFTRIQTMGLHHSLTLVPAYLSLFFILIAFISTKKIKKILYPCLVLIMSLNFTMAIVGTNSKLFTDAKISVPYREDKKQVGEVVKWLESNLNEKNNAYMITHNNTYNPDIFRNYHMPDKTIKEHLPYGSSIIGTHKFPIELFTAKYVITNYPFEKTSVDEKYEKVFEELVSQKKYALVKDFDMKNGYHTLIYERVKDVDKDEVNLYEEALEEESLVFPELYKDILEYYKKTLYK